MAAHKNILGSLILLLALALVARLGIAARPVRVATGYTLDRLPAQLAAQPAVELPLTPFEVELLAPDGGGILQRRYGHGATTLWLAAVQSQHDWRVQHPPQICYVAQGWRIEEQGVRSLPTAHQQSFSVQRMVVQKGDDRRLVFYLYTDGHHWTSSYFWRIFHALFDRAIHAQLSTWVLIQLSTPLNSADDEPRLAAAVMELQHKAP